MMSIEIACYYDYSIVMKVKLLLEIFVELRDGVFIAGFIYIDD